MLNRGLTPALWLGILIAGGLAAGAPADPAADAFLRKQVRFTDEEAAAVRAGEAVAKILDTGDPDEVVVFGVVFVKARPDAFLDMYRDFRKFPKSNAYLDLKRFSDPPRLADLAGLHLDDDDLKELQECEPGECVVQLPAALVDRLRREVNWDQPDAAATVDRLLRQGLVDLLKNYNLSGNSALGTYWDHKSPVQVAQVLRTLLDRVELLPAFLPDLHRYLLDYPKAELANKEEYLYWERVSFGLKPTFRANHVIIHRPDNLPRAPGVVAIKQLYASHYFQTALDMYFCVPVDPAAPTRGMYLMTLKGSRQAGLTGFKGGLLRRIVIPKTRSAMADGLAAFKAQLEK